MTTRSIEDVRIALGDALRTIPDLEVRDRIGGNYNPPVAVLRVGDIDEPIETFSRTGIIALPMEVWVFVSRADDELAQFSLDTYLDWVGEFSVVDALTRDSTLGGVVDSVHWNSFRNLSAEEVAGIGSFGGVWLFTVRLAKETV